MKKTLALLLLLAGLSVEAHGKELYWAGENEAVWDEHTTNWRDAFGNAQSYKDGDAVNFLGTEAGAVTVQLAGTLKPLSVVVSFTDPEHSFTFAWYGNLSGDMCLRMVSLGKLIISTENFYRGGTRLDSGTLVTNNRNALGYGPVQLVGGVLQLNGYTLSNSVTITGPQTTLGGGTLDGTLTMEERSGLTLLEDTKISGAISLAEGATLNLGKNTISGSVTLSGSATIGNGTVEGGLTVADNKSLVLLANTTVTGGVSLGVQSSLDLGGNTFHTGGEGGSQVTFSGDATVSNGTLVLDSDWSPGFALTFTDITLDLNKHTLSKAVNLVGDNAIGNGTLNTNLNVGAGDTLTLCGTLYGNQDNKDKITLGNNATLDLGGQYLDRFCYVTMKGDAFIGNGSFNSQIVVETDHKLTLSANLWGGGSIVLRNNATLDLNNHSYAGTIYGPDYDDSGTISATIGNGTLDCYLTVRRENTLNLCGDLGGSGVITLKDSATLNIGTHTLSKDVSLNGASTIKAEHTTIKALNAHKEGLLKELSVSDGLIAGTDRQASLADGLEIESTANLMIKSMTITADNKISVGQNTITLKDVTIKLSQTSYDIVDGVYYFTLSDLFHCSVDMTDVTFDASDLSLPEGFNPETNGISFNLGDAKLTSATAERDIYLLMGRYGSRTMIIDEQGRPVFTKLVETPEPTTGTLGLLALAALAARRRMHN